MARTRDPGLALLRTIEGGTRTPGAVANKALIAARLEHRELATLRSTDLTAVTSSTSSPDEALVLASHGTSVDRLWSLSTRDDVMAAFTPDDRHAIVATLEGDVRQTTGTTRFDPRAMGPRSANHLEREVDVEGGFLGIRSPPAIGSADDRGDRGHPSRGSPGSTSPRRANAGFTSTPASNASARIFAVAGD